MRRGLTLLSLISAHPAPGRAGKSRKVFFSKGLTLKGNEAKVSLLSRIDLEKGLSCDLACAGYSSEGREAKVSLLQSKTVLAKGLACALACVGCSCEGWEAKVSLL